MPDGTVEIITGKQCRRRWSADQKRRIVAESDAPEGGVNVTAARHEINASLLSTWRRQVREGRLRPLGSPGFVPVRLLATAEPSDRLLGAGSTSEVEPAGIEIALPDGIRIHIRHAAHLPLLRGVLAALRG
jgi:transposase